MGKLVTVKTGYSAVLLPNKSGDGNRNYKSGDQVTVTDTEFSNFNQATLNAITVTTSGLPDPFRKSSDTLAVPDNSSATASGAVTAKIGWNDFTLTGNVTAVNVAATNNKTQTVVGATIQVAPTQPGASAGSATTVAFRFTQDGTGSRTVTWGSKFKFAGGTAPTLSTAAGKVDIVKFVTFDGGNTFYETDRVLDIR